MANEIEIRWVSDAKQLIADQQKRLELERQINRELKATASATNKAGEAASAVSKQTSAERREEQRFWAARRKFWNTESIDRGKEEAEKRDARNKELDFWAKRREFWAEMRVAEEKAAQVRRSAADQVRRSMMTESQLARQHFRERMRYLFDLRKEGHLTQAEYRRAAVEAAKDMKSAGSVNIGGAWASAIPIVGQYLSIVGAAAAATRLVSAELQNLREKQRKSLDAVMSYDEAAQGAKSALGMDMTGAEFDKWALAASKRTGMTPEFLARAAGGALSGRGDRSAADTLRLVELMAKFERYHPESMKEMATAVVQQRGAYPGATDAQIFGQQLAAKAVSRVESNESFARNVAHLGVSARAYEDTSREAFGLAALFANTGGDAEGATSATATMNVQGDMWEEANLPGSPVKGRGTLAKLQAIATSNDPKMKAIRERLLFGAQSELAKELGMSGNKATMRSKHLTTYRRLLLNDQEVWGQLGKILGEMPELGPEAEAWTAKYEKDLGSPIHDVAKRRQGLQAGTARHRLGDTAGADAAVSREELSEALQAAGVPNYQQVLEGVVFEFSSEMGEYVPRQKARDILMRQAQMLAARKTRLPFRGVTEPLMLANPITAPSVLVGNPALERPASEAELRGAQYLREQASLLSDPIVNELHEIKELLRDRPGAQVNVQVPGADVKPGAPAAAGLEDAAGLNALRDAATRRGWGK